MTAKQYGPEFLRQAAEAQRMARALTVASDPTARFDGTDETGTVRAFVDRAGQVVDFEVAANWRRTLDPRRLGAAAQQAVAAAVTAGMTRLAGTMATARSRFDAVPVEPVAEPEPGPVRPSPAAAQHGLSLIERMRAERAAGRNVPQATVTRHSAGGHITVTSVGGRVSGVAVESRWNAGHLEVAAELRSAFRAAAAAPAPAEPGAGSEVRSLTADPQRFLAVMFGLPQPQDRR